MKRHTRAQVREQRSRWIRKRLGQIRRQWTMYPEQGDGLLNWHHPPGTLNKQDPWDCGNTQCGICRWGGYGRRDGRERLRVASELESLKG